MSTFALIAAAGSGSRFAGDVPKQYASLAGRPVLAHAIARVAAAFGDASLHVLLAPDDTAYERCIGAVPGVGVIRCGDATRAATFRNGL